MRFSIIVPVYNAERYLADCIESVLRQTWQNFELLLVDDGSTDKSGAICDAFAQKYTNISVCHKENRGQMHSRQIGIKMATGDVYVFLDADDTLCQNALEVIREKMLTYDCDCVIYEFERQCNGQCIEKNPELLQQDKVITDKRQLYRMVFLNHRYNSLCRKAVKASVFTGKKWDEYYRVSHGEDLLQSLEILENADRVVVIPNTLYLYRIHETNMTRALSVDNYPINFTVEEQVLLLLKRSGVFTERDFWELHNYRIWQLIEKLRLIATMDAPREQKTMMFEKIKQTEFYANELTSAKLSECFYKGKILYYYLFRYGWYHAIIMLETSYSRLRSYAVKKG